jgi:hypothetical protein
MFNLVFFSLSNWLRLREDTVFAKGKGELTTYWLEIKSNSSGCKSNRSSESGACTSSENVRDEDESQSHGDLRENRKKSKKLDHEKVDRLIDWNADVLSRLLQQVIANRIDSASPSFCDAGTDQSYDISLQKGINPFDEVKEIIALPQVKKLKKQNYISTVSVSNEVSHLLRDYVSKIAFMYNDNHFHNFEHVSIVLFI